MSLVTIYSGGTERSADAVASRTWRLPVAGEAGQASVFVPYSSSLVDVIDMQAGFTILIHDAGGCGSWWGVGVDAEWSEGGITITAMQAWWILGRRSIDLTGVRRVVSPAYLVTTVLLNGGEVLGLTAPNAPFGGDGPSVPYYNLDRQDIWAVITDQMNQSENELWVDPETQQMSWIGPLAEASAYGPLLIAGQSFTGWSYRESNADRVSEVVGIYFVGSVARSVQGTRNSGGTFQYGAQHGESALAGWPARATVEAEAPYALVAAAHAELNRRAFPSIIISGQLSRSHIAIRERDFPDVFVPRKGLTHTCRVLARTVDDAATGIGVELQVMPANSITTTIKPPGAVSRDTGRGTGSLSQRMVHTNRRTGRTR